MKRGPRYGETVFAILPTVWWGISRVAESLYTGWFHDPQFPRIYGLALAALRGTRAVPMPQAAIGLQDGVLSVIVAAALGVGLARLSFWQGSVVLRRLCVLVSIVVPWQPVVWFCVDTRQWYSEVATELIVACVVASAAGLFAPISSLARGALLTLAVGLGIALSTWLFEPGWWFLFGSLVAAFGLLGCCATRAFFLEERGRRTRG